MQPRKFSYTQKMHFSLLFIIVIAVVVVVAVSTKCFDSSKVLITS